MAAATGRYWGKDGAASTNVKERPRQTERFSRGAGGTGNLARYGVAATARRLNRRCPQAAVKCRGRRVFNRRRSYLRDSAIVGCSRRGLQVERRASDSCRCAEVFDGGWKRAAPWVLPARLGARSRPPERGETGRRGSQTAATSLRLGNWLDDGPRVARASQPWAG